MSLMADKKPLSKGLKIGIGGIVISVVPESTFQGFRIDDDHGRFITEGEPEVVLRFHYGDLSDEYDLGEKIFDSGGIWSFHRRNGKYLLRISYSDSNSTPDKIAVFEPDFRSGDVHISDRRPNGPVASDPFLYPFAGLFMINLLSQGRGVLIHSCGVDDDGQGLLFAGESGAGKSSLANLWKNKKNVTVLSDDRIIIRKIDGRLWMYGTPWHGDAGICSPEKAPLEKVFFLKHAKKNEIKKIAPIDTASRLIVCSFPTFWDKKGMEFTLNFCAELSGEVPCYELGFVPDESVLDLVKSV